MSELSTFDRSCQHWSEAGRAGMEAFYQLATLDYRLLAEELDWASLLRELTPNRLLDVACGSGKFPRSLLEHAELDRASEIAYSLLDPSDFSVREAKAQLAAPFVPADEYVCTAQALECPAGHYDVVWATHALYCVPATELPAALGKMTHALNPAGLGFIAHATEQAHYLRFQTKYLASGVGKCEPYSTAAQVEEALSALTPVTARTIRYEGTVPLAERATAEGYLQRCLFDDSLSMDAMLNDPVMGAYLRGLMDEVAGLWRFPQEVKLLFFGEARGLIDRP